jgi:hypothetical protein
MSPAQSALYFREWGKVRAHYIAKGIDPKQAEHKRHELHKKALGTDKSSKGFTNADLDRVLAAFYAITRPADLTAQLRQIDQPELRMAEARKACMEILAEIGIGAGHDAIKADFLRRSYLDAITKNITRGAQVDFQGLSDRQANHVLHTLRLRLLAQKQAAKKHATPVAAGAKDDDENCPF